MKTVAILPLAMRMHVSLTHGWDIGVKPADERTDDDETYLGSITLYKSPHLKFTAILSLSFVMSY